MNTNVDVFLYDAPRLEELTFTVSITPEGVQLKSADTRLTLYVMGDIYTADVHDAQVRVAKKLLKGFKDYLALIEKR